MKTRLLLSIALSGFFVCASLAQYASFPYESNAMDEKEKLDATPTATGLTYVKDSERNNVIEFDGANGSITLGTNVYNFDAVTYNIWFKWTTATINQWWVRIFDFGKPSDPDPGNHDVMFVTTFADGKLRWVIHSMAADGGVDTIINSTDSIDLNKWYMLTLVHSDTAKLYLDGVLNGSKAIGFKPNQLSFDNCYIGKSNWPDPLFTGRMDEFKVWNSALTAAEITALYTFPEVIDGINTPEIEFAKIYSTGNILKINLLDGVESASVQVFNYLGQEVYSISNMNNYVEINSLRTGNYIVRVNTGEGYTVKKVVIR